MNPHGPYIEFAMIRLRQRYIMLTMDTIIKAPEFIPVVCRLQPVSFAPINKHHSMGEGLDIPLSCYERK
jgi:hypothetical protein